MKEIIAVVENGQIRIPDSVCLPEGSKVRILWDERDEVASRPYDREMLTEEDVKADLKWATGTRFPS